MAAIDQINVNIGTEQSPNYVLHDVNDKRISSTAVTTATHLLATDASLSAINPITAANLASVLGGLNGIKLYEHDAPGYGETLITPLLNRGIIVVSINGSKSTSVYALNGEGTIHPILEGSTTKVSNGSVYNVSISGNNIVFIQTSEDSYNYKLHVVQILG